MVQGLHNFLYPLTVGDESPVCFWMCKIKNVLTPLDLSKVEIIYVVRIAWW